MLLTILLLVISAKKLTSRLESVLKSQIPLMMASYCQPKAITDKSCLFCSEPEFQNLTNITAILTPDKLHQLFLAYNSQTKRIVVSIRGTKEKGNWLQNFNPTMSPLLGYEKTEAMVHSEFQKAAMKLMKMMHGPISRIMQAYPVSTIAIIGHSSGGAMSMILAVLASKFGFLRSFDLSKVYIYSAGSPPVGNYKWVDLYESMAFGYTYRLTNEKDVVSLVPAGTFGFRDVYTEREILIKDGASKYNYQAWQCEEQDRLLDQMYTRGSCFNRFTWNEVISNVKDLWENHMTYLGYRLQDC